MSNDDPAVTEVTIYNGSGKPIAKAKINAVEPIEHGLSQEDIWNLIKKGVLPILEDLQIPKTGK